MIVSEFRDLAAEIARDTGLELEAAERLAWQQMPELLNDVMMDVRYKPRKVVLFDLMDTGECGCDGVETGRHASSCVLFPLTARELVDLTER